MQLILETAPTLSVDTDMSTVEDIQNEKIGKGEINDLNTNTCNGNKENIENEGDVTVIVSDDLNKQVIEEIGDSVDNAATNLNPDESINSHSPKEAQVEESQSETIVEPNDVYGIQTEVNDVVKETEQEAITDVNENPTEDVQENNVGDISEVISEDEDDIITIKDANLDQTKDVADREIENPVLENSSATSKENAILSNDDVELIEDLETPINTETPKNSDGDIEIMKELNFVLKTDTPTIPNNDIEFIEEEMETPIKTETPTISNDDIEVIEELETPVKTETPTIPNDDIEVIEEEMETPIKTETPTFPNDDIEVIEELETTIKTETPTIPNDDIEVIEELETPIKTESPTNLYDDIELIEEDMETPIKTETVAISDSEVMEELETLLRTETPKNVNLDEKINSSEPEPKHDVNIQVDDKTSDNKSQTTLQKDVEDSSPIELKDDMDVEEIVDETLKNKQNTEVKDTVVVNTNNVDKPVCRLSNTLDILSDDEELPNKDSDTPKEVESNDNDKQCINIEDDDDIMLIDEDTCKTESPTPVEISNKAEDPTSVVKTDMETGEKAVETVENNDLFATKSQTESTPPPDVQTSGLQIDISEKKEEKEIKKPEIPLLPDNFIKTAKKNLSDMTRDDLEEFCILKIVESIVDRSSLSEIKIKLKSLSQALEEQKKKAFAIAKQNRDLQVVLKSVQEEQKKMTPDSCITPLKITRSVGLQVVMEKSGVRRKPNAPGMQPQTTNVPANRSNVKNSPAQGPRQQKAAAQAIPVPRLVPANNTANKTPNVIPQLTPVTPIKAATTMPNGIKNPSPSQKVAEKRQHNRTMSVTVDLTDDEPPAKMNNRSSPAPPVRLVPSQSLMAPRQFSANNSGTPRKVYIPISCPLNQNLRPGQTVVLKPVNNPGIRPRGLMSQGARGSSNAVRLQQVTKLQSTRHPAPLPDAMKQYQPPNWKALPPAPDLKLSKVENGIVISWKIEGYQEDSYEEIASYQLYAYQETSCPPCTSLWKKIGDVKALPLPMACTLTQFMAGFKYYFAVRAVDIRSRLGPFSLPGSILLVNKL